LAEAYETVEYEIWRNTAWITLNRPDKMNAINAAMLNEISNLIDLIENDRRVKSLIVIGKGDKAFSAGADINELQQLTSKTAADFSRQGQQVFTKLANLSKPTVAAINGYAIGGGLELALACDFRLASRNAELGLPETGLGIIPGWGGTQRLPLLVGVSAAKRMIMLGDRIKADEAETLGLVQKVVAFRELKLEATVLAQRLIQYPLEALKCAKYAIESVHSGRLEAGLKKETELFAKLVKDGVAKERMRIFLSGRNKNEGACKSK